MLIEKEIIRPGRYWYREEGSGLPRVLDATPEFVRHLREQGSAMLSSGLTVPVPFEHDFGAHPMTPADKLRNNSGWVKEYRLKDIHDPKTNRTIKDVLFGVVDVTDEATAKKLPHTIRWTSPWITSFTDGKGKQWNNVISHLALTTRPRIVEQQPFPSVAAALSLATEVKASTDGGGGGAGSTGPTGAHGFCLSRAGRLFIGKKSKRQRPRYPMAFSMWAGGVRLAEEDEIPKKKVPGEEDELPDDELPEGDEMGAPMPPPMPGAGMMNPLMDQNGDVGMEELLCDLLNALGVHMPDNVGEHEFKRALYEATMGKIKELTAGAQAGGQQGAGPDQAATNTISPAGGQQGNPIIQQEQQPMYMSLDDIRKLDEPLKSVALSMYNETVKANAKAAEAEKVLNSLRDAKLAEASSARQKRVGLLSKLSPRVKQDLDVMLALPSMALSLGDGGQVVDPMATTLAVLEKGLADMPRLLTTEAAALAVQPQPRDGDEMTPEQVDAIADSFARSMGAPPQKQAS